jgi:hypothetical protein
MSPSRALPLVALAIALGACGTYARTGRVVAPDEIRGPGWVRVDPIVYVAQDGPDDCGLAAATMILAHHDPARPRPRLDFPPKGGITAAQLRDRLHRLGELDAYVVAGTLADLEHELGEGRPVVVGTVKRVDRRRGRPHYEVVVAVHPARREIVTLDPAIGMRASSYADFLREWRPARTTLIVALPPGSAEPVATIAGIPGP